MEDREQELSQSTINSSETEKMPEQEIRVCMACREHNLTDQTQFNNCKQCNQVYCLHYASAIDPSLCTSCLHDVTVKEEIITKTQTHYNPITDKLISRTRKAKRVELGGMHWLFQARKINDLSDLELELAIEYHNDILRSMLLERDERRINHFHRNKGKGLPIKFDSNTVSETTETVEVKKTTIKRAVKASPEELLAAAMQTLLKAGLSAEAIAKMAVGKK